MRVINKRVCPYCGQSINERKISLFRGMVVPLARVYRWCVEHNRHEFSRKDIKHLLIGDNQIARFGDWVMFGGLLYKKGRGQWGMNMERTKAFLDGSITIPTTIWKNPINGELQKEDNRYIKDIPNLSIYLEDGYYIVEYRK